MIRRYLIFCRILIFESQVWGWICNFFKIYIYPDQLGAWLRFLLILVGLALYTRFGYQRYPSSDLDYILQSWIDRIKGLGILPDQLLSIFAFLRHEPRFLWLAIWSLIAAMLIGASFLRTTYGLPRLWNTFRYLFSSLTGIRYPRVEIDNGCLQIGDNETNLTTEIGGPGWVTVQPGNIALLEYLHEPARVQADDMILLSRFETIKRFKSDFESNGWEIPTTAEHHGNVKSVTATTKDGITLVVEDINYRYRLRLGRAHEDLISRDPKNPNPFSVEAVRSLAYNRTVRIKTQETGETELTPWHNLINFSVEGAITDFIREHRFNDVVVPAFGDEPRQQIAERMLSRNIQSRLESNGADLLWADIGHFRIQDHKIATQLVDRWGTVWDGEADVRRAYGEAHRIELMQRGRAEAQAELLIEIMNTFQDLNLHENPQANIENLLLARTAQILDGMKDRDDDSYRPQYPPLLLG